MKLADVEMIPGVVVDDEDPKFLGRLKISAPGEFEVDSMDINDMFWVYPFPVGGYQSFSHMLKGSKVWLIKNTKNYYEYWYLPYFEMNSNTFNLVNSKKKYDADVDKAELAGLLHDLYQEVMALITYKCIIIQKMELIKR